ncbi:PqqD family peptide modification chaperone [Clostridium sp. UBA1652]|uniref:PqqD family peptide modification chaperone n=1 Tax=Clostridium sp. UBA1652 TaxID=1946348 RepID=UPI00257B5361|nr:PqqD family peptide modification chaperone [Clostridium sp. UBA1652]
MRKDMIHITPKVKGKIRKEKWGGLYYFRDLVYIDVVNEVAYEIISRCNGEKTVATITEEIAELFDAPIHMIEQDVASYINALIYAGQVTIPGISEEELTKIRNSATKECEENLVETTDSQDERIQKVLNGKGILGVAPNELSAPIKVLIEFTHNCNLKCVHCFASAEYCEQTPEGYLEGELSKEQWFQIIDDISESGVFDVFVSGGEALMRKDIFDIMDYIGKKDMGFCLLSNTTLITGEIAQKLKATKCYKIESNLDGYNPETYDAFRGVDGAFDATIEGIKACLRNGIGVRCNLTETKMNANYIKKVVEVAYDIGVRELCVVPLEPGGRARENWDEISLSIDERIAMKEVYKEISQWVEETYNNEFFFAAPLDIYQVEESQWVDVFNPGRFYPICGAGKLHCSIGPKGDVMVCPTAGVTLPIHPGNCLETNFKTIWQEGDIFKEIRDIKVEPCVSCEYKNCGGGCAVRSHMKYGKVNQGPTDFCKKVIVSHIEKMKGNKNECYK